MAQDFDFIVLISLMWVQEEKYAPCDGSVCYASNRVRTTGGRLAPAKQEKQWRVFIAESRPIVHSLVVGIVAQPGAGKPCPVW
jgi:hypothetical protein